MKKTILSLLLGAFIMTGLSANPSRASGTVAVVYFSATGTTERMAKNAAQAMGADLFEIEPVHKYTDADLNWHDKKSLTTIECNDPKSRPAIANKIDISSYDTVVLCYPIWWASIPMPIATLLESYDFSGKKILPFCSHGGGRFGQSLTAIAKLAPKAKMEEGLSIHYSGGSSLSKDVEKWLKKTGVK